MKRPHWTDLLAKELAAEKEDKIHKGWFSCETVAKELGVTERAVQYKLLKLFKQGKLERRLFNVVASHGYLRKTFFYHKK